MLSAHGRARSRFILERSEWVCAWERFSQVTYLGDRRRRVEEGDRQPFSVVAFDHGDPGVGRSTRRTEPTGTRSAISPPGSSFRRRGETTTGARLFYGSQEGMEVRLSPEKITD